MSAPDLHLAPRSFSRRTLLVRLAVLVLLWLVLTGGTLKSWMVGVPAILLALWTSYAIELRLPWPWSMRGAVRFVPFFFSRALLGGFDVARRVLDPRLPINPKLLTFQLRLPAGPACVVLADVISLLPGSLTARLHEQTLWLHVIDVQLPIESQLREAEQAVADLLGIPLAEPVESERSR